MIEQEETVSGIKINYNRAVGKINGLLSELSTQTFAKRLTS